MIADLFLADVVLSRLIVVRIVWFRDVVSVTFAFVLDLIRLITVWTMNFLYRQSAA